MAELVAAPRTEEQERVIQEAVTNLLVALGEDPTREGLIKTPKRVAKSFLYLTKGYEEDLTS